VAALRLGEAEIAADFGDDLRDRPVAQLVLHPQRVQPVQQFVVQPVRFVVLRGALDRVLDLADDPLAGGGALPPALDRGGVSEGLGELVRQHYAASHGAAEAVIGDRGVLDIHRTRAGRSSWRVGSVWAVSSASV
jgi:hypothetical protein